MAGRERKEKETWLGYFNPCGTEPVNGYVQLTCVSPDCMKVPCMAKSAYIMAGYLIKGGTSLKEEKEELDRHLRQNLIGRKIVRVNGKTNTLTRQNLNEFVDEVGEKAQKLVKEVEMCVRLSTPLSEEYLSKCTPEQRDVLNRIYMKSRFLRDYDGGQHTAKVHEKEMREIVEEALDLGLGELGLIARYAIGFGLGNRVPQFTTSSEIFVWPGEDKLQPKPTIKR